MTRYVGEPSPEKTLMERTAAIETLARRPAAAALLPTYPALRARRNAMANLLVGDQATVRIPFDVFTAENDALLRRNSSDPNEPNPSTVDYVALRKKGLYVMSASLRWLGIWGGERGIFCNYGASGAPATEVISLDPFQLAPHNSAHTQVDDEAYGFAFVNANVDATLELHATQRSGASRELVNSCIWEIIYIGPTSLDT